MPGRPAPGPMPGRPAPGPAGRAGYMPGPGRGPPGAPPWGRAGKPPAAGRAPAGRAGIPGMPGRSPPGRGGMPGMPGRGPAGRGGIGTALRSGGEVKGLLPGRGPGAGRGPGVGRGSAVPGSATSSPDGRGASGAGGAGDGAGGAARGCGAAATGCWGGAGAAGSVAAFAAPLAAAPFPAAAPLPAAPVPAGNASRSLRITGASIVEDADRTYSPSSVSLAIKTLLSTPNSLASSCTRTLATGLLSRSAAGPRDRRRYCMVLLITCCSSSAHSPSRPASDSTVPPTLRRTATCSSRYARSASHSSGPASRKARGNALRRTARSRQSESRCSDAPRPGSRPRGSGTSAPEIPTTRNRSGFAARDRQPTQVRTGAVRRTTGKSSATARRRNPVARPGWPARQARRRSGCRSASR